MYTHQLYILHMNMYTHIYHTYAQVYTYTQHMLTYTHMNIHAPNTHMYTITK